MGFGRGQMIRSCFRSPLHHQHTPPAFDSMSILNLTCLESSQRELSTHPRSRLPPAASVQAGVKLFALSVSGRAGGSRPNDTSLGRRWKPDGLNLWLRWWDCLSDSRTHLHLLRVNMEMNTGGGGPPSIIQRRAVADVSLTYMHRWVYDARSFWADSPLLPLNDSLIMPAVHVCGWTAVVSMWQHVK